MLRVWMTSGEELATLPGNCEVRDVKAHLQRLCDVTRFRQKLLHDGVSLDDEVMLSATMDLQLVLLSFWPTVAAQADELTQAARDGDEMLVTRILQRPQDPNLTSILPPGDEWTVTPLFYAAEQGHQSIVQLLVEAKADPDGGIRQVRGRTVGRHATPLVKAASKGHDEIVELLLEAGAEKDQICPILLYDATALVVAAVQGHVDVVRALLLFGADVEKGCDVDVDCLPFFHDGTALQVACERGHVAIVRLLIEAGADIEKGFQVRQEKGHRHPLLAVLENDHGMMVRLLLDAAGIDETFDTSSTHWTPLVSAARNGHVEIAEILLETGRRRGRACSCGAAALWLSASGDHDGFVRLLLDSISAGDLKL